MRRNLEITIKLPYQIKLTPQTPKTTENSLFLRFFFSRGELLRGGPYGKIGNFVEDPFFDENPQLASEGAQGEFGAGREPAESRLKAGSQPALGRLKAGVGLAEGAPT